MLEIDQRVDVAALGLANADLGYRRMGKTGRHRRRRDTIPASPWVRTGEPPFRWITIDRGRESAPIPPRGAFEPVGRLPRPTGRAAARAGTGAKEKSRKFRRSISPPERRVVIGACAPIHPRVGPAVRPDVCIRARPLFLLQNYGFRRVRPTSKPTL